MARAFLAVWLALFALQATEVVALVAPDSCTADAEGFAADPCPEGCPRCLCCARVPAYVQQTAAADLVQRTTPATVAPPLAPPTDPGPRGILHVPKNS